jgi:uncharacterized membrane protein
MSTQYVLTLALCIGIVAGLRAVTAPAAVSWAARLHWLNLFGSPLAFMGSTIAVIVFSLGAIGEYVNDKLPKTPSRTAPLGFVARIVTGALSGACLCASARRPLLAGALMGALGAVIGTLGGYQARTRLVKALNVKDLFVAIPEDLIAIGPGFLTVSLAFTR